jgi:hypothetical protein
VRSALNKLGDIYVTIASKQVQVMAATETWLHDEIEDSLVSFPNFNHHRCDRRGRRGGGVCVWTLSSIDVKRLSPTNQPDFLDTVWLSFPRVRVIFICIYIPPDYAITQRSVVNEFIIASVDAFLSYLCDFDFDMWRFQ